MDRQPVLISDATPLSGRVSRFFPPGLLGRKLAKCFQPKSPKSRNSGELRSHRRSYRLHSELGRGDLCTVYRATSGRADYIVKLCPMANPSELLDREAAVLHQLSRGSSWRTYSKYLPQWVESIRHDGCANVFRAVDGSFTAEEVRSVHRDGLPAEHIAWMFNRVLEVLGFVHQRGWVHAAVLPAHLLFQTDCHGLQLIDWIHATPLGQPVRVVPTRFKDWYPPECKHGGAATQSMDIYLAAKSMIYLAGGDPNSNRIAPSFPGQIRRFLAGCLMESPRMRPHDAWSLRDEFGDLLVGLFGPPQFHHLEMP